MDWHRFGSKYDDPEKEGYLKMRYGTNIITHRWVQRWCVLKDELFSFFKSPDVSQLHTPFPFLITIIIIITNIDLTLIGSD